MIFLIFVFSLVAILLLVAGFFLFVKLYSGRNEYSLWNQGFLTSKIVLVHNRAEGTTGKVFILTSALFQITVNLTFKTNKI